MRKREHITIEDFSSIQIGDSVYWENKHLESNHDIFWTVVSKDETQNMLEIEAHEMGANDKFWISYRDVYIVQHRMNKRI